ncbi:MAG: carbohydrate kinase family protein [Syntrophobacteraceae bacterium]
MNSELLDVVVVGNVGIDTNTYMYGDSIDCSIESSFTEIIDYVGQAGGYCSRGFAQLKKRTAFIGYLGDDYNGRFIREEFSRDGIDTTAVFIDPSGTSRSINLVYRDGRRKNFYDGKGHMALHPNIALCRAVLSRTKLVHFNIPNWARYLLPVAKDLGLSIACDIQDVWAEVDSYREDFVKYADILFFSAVNQSDPKALIQSLLSANPKQIIVAGMGAKGCALGTSRNGIQFFDPVAMEMPVIDTNGAGDGLAVGFLASYVLDNRSVDDAVQRGQIAARYTCTLKASSSNLITPAKLDYYSIDKHSAT